MEHSWAQRGPNEVLPTCGEEDLNLGYSQDDDDQTMSLSHMNKF